MDQSDSLLTNTKYDVCITTITFFPDINATAKLMYDLAGDLADKGLKVVVLTQNRSYHDPNKIFPSFERIGGFDVIRVSLPSFDKNKGLAKLLMYLFFAQKASAKVKKIQANLFFAVFPPFFAAYYMMKKCLERSIPFVLILHDLHPDTAIRRKQISARHPLALLLKRQTRALMKESTRIVTLGRDVNEYLKRIYGVTDDRMVYIPNWGRPMPSFHGAKPDEEAPFTVLYAGNFGEASDFWTLLKAAKKVQELDRKISFLLVGNGRKRAALEDYAKKEQIDNIRFSDFLPEEEYLELLRQASVCVVTLRESSMGMSVPSKFYYYLSAGKPILAILPEQSEVARAINEDCLGCVCTNDDPDCAAEAILKLKKDTDFYEKICMNVENVFRRKYSQQVCTEKYFNLIKELAGSCDK